MAPQAWIAIIIFVIAIIFSIVMASISKAFRTDWKLTEVWNYALFFTIILTAAILMTMSVQCSGVAGKFDESVGYCRSYAWVLVVLLLALLALFMTRAIMNHIEEKKKTDEVVESTIKVYTE